MSGWDSPTLVPCLSHNPDESRRSAGGTEFWEVPFTSQGKGTRSGLADIWITDGNQGGPADLKGDSLEIQLWENTGDGGYELTYINDGVLEGGNIKVIPEAIPE